MDDENRRFSPFTKEDNRRLQVLQNKVMRMKTNLPRDTPTVDLVKAAGDLSVQQLTAYHTVMTVYRSVTSGKPKYISDRFKLKRPENGIFPHRQHGKIEIAPRKLSLSKGAFIYRGATLFNLLPFNLRTENKIQRFKQNVKK